MRVRIFQSRNLEALQNAVNTWLKTNPVTSIGRTLMEQVNNLIKSERIPPLVADIAHLGRQIGNLGAHFDKEEVTEEDVMAMLDFLETILEYLYVLPPKVATVKARLSRTS